VGAQSNNKRGPTELVQHSAYRGTSHRSNGAASHIIDLLWLNCSPISVGRKGVFYSICSYTYTDYLPSRRLEEGGGGGKRQNTIKI
jgi:hypothetical protein